MGMGQYPVLSRGPTPPPLLQTLVAPAVFQTFVARHYMMDPACRKKPIFATNFVARGRPGPVTKQKLLTCCHIVRIGFWCPLTLDYNHNKEPPKIVSVIII